MNTSIVVPTYNERQTAPITIEKALETCHKNVDFIVVDDSSDGTAGVIEERFQTSRVAVIDGPGRGLSAAVQKGWWKTKPMADILGVMDADGQHPPSKLPILVEHVESGADVAVGSRFVRCTSAGVGSWSLRRRLISYGARKIAQRAVPPAGWTSDPLSGFFTVDADVLWPSWDEFDPVGYKILLEVLGRCPVENVADVSYEFQPRMAGESNLDGGEIMHFLEHCGRLSVASRRRMIE